MSRNTEAIYKACSNFIVTYHRKVWSVSALKVKSEALELAKQELVQTLNSYGSHPQGASWNCPHCGELEAGSHGPDCHYEP